MLFLLFVVMNAATFFAYGHDKEQAQLGGRRIPERRLLALALCGGGTGAYAGMQAFRHKTRKAAFVFANGLLCLTQIGVVLWLMTR